MCVCVCVCVCVHSMTLHAAICVVELVNNSVCAGVQVCVCVCVCVVLLYIPFLYV